MKNQKKFLEKLYICKRGDKKTSLSDLLLKSRHILGIQKDIVNTLTFKVTILSFTR
jgi:hypothetical protein